MRVEVYGEPRGEWGEMCLESLVDFCRQRMCMAFKMKMDENRGGGGGGLGCVVVWRRFELVSKRGKWCLEGLHP